MPGAPDFYFGQVFESVRAIGTVSRLNWYFNLYASNNDGHRQDVGTLRMAPYSERGAVASQKTVQLVFLGAVPPLQYSQSQSHPTSRAARLSRSGGERDMVYWAIPRPSTA